MIANRVRGRTRSSAAPKYVLYVPAADETGSFLVPERMGRKRGNLLRYVRYVQYVTHHLQPS